MAINDNHIQNLLFHHIKSIDPLLWKERVAKLLGISYSTLYKKARSETSLTTRELQLIIDLYHIPLHKIFADYSSFTRMVVPALNTTLSSINDFLTKLAGELTMVHRDFQAKVYYASSEVPIFHYMHTPTLAAFKLAVWAKTVWNIHQDIHLEALVRKIVTDEQFLTLRKSLLNGFCSVSSLELWPVTLLDNSINQIQYYIWSLDLVDEDLIQTLLSDLSKLVDHFNEMATLGKKFVIGQQPHIDHQPFDLYFNEIFHTNNTILMESYDKRVVFLTHDSPNYIKCEDDTFINHTKGWMDRMIQMSLKISTDNARHRKRYFGLLKSKVDTLQLSVNAFKAL